MNVDIYITDKAGNREIQIPWLPEEVNYDTKGALFASYSILDRGEVQLPAGENLSYFSWESIFPGPGRKNDSLQRGSWKTPKTYQDILDSWRKSGTLLQLVVTGTPINHDVYLDDFECSYNGPFGDFEYKISFVVAKSITISTVKKKKPNSSSSSSGSSSSSSKKRTESKSSAKTYTVKKGDTLWSISKRYLGKGSRWREIYKLNKAIIESTAKKRGYKSSLSGNRIFSGTKLKIKK